jgi:hypothetical protein
MKIATDSYLNQVKHWPNSGNQIVSQLDQASIVVYQDYCPEIGEFAVKNQYFGGAFSLNRMSWIKPNFLWMMYRSGWGRKAGQDVILAVRIQRQVFDTLLGMAVHSSYVPEIYSSETAWKTAVAQSSVRLQWDPDHHPSGGKLERRAIQLGLRGQILARYAKDWILETEDISEFVQEQRHHLTAGYESLIVPTEATYPVSNVETIVRLGLVNSMNT